MWKGTSGRPVALAAAGLFLLFEAAGWNRNDEESISRAATFRLLEGGEDSADAVLAAARRALELNPASAYRWCDLAEAFLEAGDVERARRCFERAEKLAPAIPEVLLRVFYGAARQGREAEGIRLAHRILDLVRAHDNAIYGIYLNFDAKNAGPIHPGFPASAAPSLVRYALSGGDFETARAAWRWLAAHSPPDDRLALEYAGGLCRAGRRAEARAIWAAHTRGPDEPVWNGGWESDRSAGPLDWELHAPGNGRAARVCSAAAEGRCSLRIMVDWPDRHFFEGVEQRVALEPGSYRLSARFRIEGAAGFGVRAAGPGFDARSPGLPESSAGWREAAVDFHVAAPGEVRIGVYRNPGPGAEGEVRGTVWVDSVRLAPR